MKNVYNHTSGAEKGIDCALHQCVSVVPVPAWMLKLGIVVTLTDTAAEEGSGLPAGQVSRAARERQERGGVNIVRMGSTVSVLEKAAQKSLPELADRADAKLTEGEISGLLLWYRRRKLIAMTDRLFDLAVWQRIGDSVQVGNKEERLLAPVFRAVKSMTS